MSPGLMSFKRVVKPRPVGNSQIMSTIKPAIREYNYHNWSRFMVQKPDQAPVGPHYAAILFGTHREHSGYENDSGYDVPEVTYFAFIDKKDLETWVAEAVQDKKKFFFFQVRQLGEATVRVNVNMEVG